MIATAEPQSYFTKLSDATVYLKGFNTKRLLNKEEEKILVLQAKAGDLKARNILIRQNILFIVRTAFVYKWSKLGTRDLINEGVFGLVEAIDRFDPSRGLRLMSYATWWIKNRMQRAFIGKTSSIRIPNNVYIAYKKGLREAQGDISKLNENLQKVHVAENLISLDTPTPSDSNNISTLKDSIIDQDTLDEEYDNEEKTLVSHSLQFLDEREKEVIEMYYGLNGSDSYDLRTIARVKNLSHERIRQIKELGLKKIEVFIKTSL